MSITIKDGKTVGFPSGLNGMDYEAINLVREAYIDVRNLWNVKRGNNVDRVFEGVLGPKVVEGTINSGCESLPDPTCLTTYRFTSSIDKQRLINELLPSCSWEHMSAALKQNYIKQVVEAWTEHELKSGLTYINGVVTSVTSKETNILDVISEMVLDCMVKASQNEVTKQLGRRDLTILISSKIANEIQKLAHKCCSVRDVNRNATTNIWGVKQVLEVEPSLMPSGSDIIVYFDRLVFEITVCTQNPQITEIGEVKRNPNTKRLFANELYGYDHFKQPTDTGAESAFIGEKYFLTTP